MAARDHHNTLSHRQPPNGHAATASAQARSECLEDTGADAARQHAQRIATLSRCACRRRSEEGSCEWTDRPTKQ